MTGFAPVLFGGLMAWSIYRRVRRNIGQQPLRPARSIFSIVILSLVSVLLIGMSLTMPGLLAGIGGGFLIGAALGFVGLRLTKFETTEQGHFYTPNAHIGVALSVLFVGRMLFRFWVLRNGVPTGGPPPMFQSPLTLLLFGLIAGYYLVFHIGILVHNRDRIHFAK